MMRHKNLLLILALIFGMGCLAMLFLVDTTDQVNTTPVTKEIAIPEKQNASPFTYEIIEIEKHDFIYVAPDILVHSPECIICKPSTMVCE